MKCQSSKGKPQMCADQTPCYDRKGKTARSNQVIGRKSNIIRKDKRQKVRYL